MVTLLSVAFALPFLPHHNQAVDLYVEVPLGPGEPRGRQLGVHVGAGLPMLIGRNFLAGPRVGLRFNAEDVYVLELGANAGVMHAELAGVGWMPLWQAEARVQAEVGTRGVSMAVGGMGSRSLSYQQRIPNGTCCGFGFQPLALQVGYLTRPVGIQRPDTFVVGLGMHLRAATAF